MEQELDEEKRQLAKQKVEEKKKALRAKIQDIIKIKGKLKVFVGGKNIEQLDDYDLEDQGEEQIDLLKQRIQKYIENNF